MVSQRFGQILEHTLSAIYLLKFSTALPVSACFLWHSNPIRVDYCCPSYTRFGNAFQLKSSKHTDFAPLVLSRVASSLLFKQTKRGFLGSPLYMHNLVIRQKLEFMLRFYGSLSLWFLAAGICFLNFHFFSLELISGTLSQSGSIFLLSRPWKLGSVLRPQCHNLTILNFSSWSFWTMNSSHSICSWTFFLCL